MSLLDKLLQTDIGVLKVDKVVQMEIPRLTEVLGEPFILDLIPVEAERYIELQTRMLEVDKGKVKDIDLYKFYIHLLVEGISNTEFNNPKLLTKFGAATPMDVYKKLFNAGEITRIASKISNISGFDAEEIEKEVEEIKN